MNNSLRIQLEWYYRQDINTLTLSQLSDFIWHVEHLKLTLLQVYNERQLRAPVGK